MPFPGINEWIVTYVYTEPLPAFKKEQYKYMLNKDKFPK